jgi:bisphosphoglycerate-independent phosphoglycerate mutase (AlkP superfamily)
VHEVDPDIAPTLLEPMDLPQPKEMTGASLLRAD